MMVAGDRHLDRTGAGLGRTHQRAEADRRPSVVGALFTLQRAAMRRARTS
ncbi:hypothetical protein X747_30980 [Mesorhizobium sp. LNJC384A00]|nr:hypothetical protein X747_30980 [Mesorhizobium sp. LNJC384A00]